MVDKAKKALPTEGAGPWHAPSVLMLILALSWVDRLLPGALLDPMRRDLGLTNGEAGAIVGTAFAVCQGAAAIPLGWMADRGNRRVLLATAIAIWSLLTLGTAFAQGFGDLFVFRMGVGLGEAALLPAAYALLGDLYDERRRPSAVAVMLLGTPIGTGLALLGGGILFQLFQSGGSFPGNTAWRPVFAVVGVAGLMFALLALTLPEPRKSVPLPSMAQVKEQEPSMRQFLSSGSTAFWWLCAGVVLANMFAAGFMFWMAPRFSRSFDLSTGQVGAVLGAITLLAGFVGSPLAALLIKRMNGSHLDRSLLGLASCTAIVAVLVPLSCALRSAIFSYGVTALLLTVTFVATALLPMALIAIAPSAVRARATAVALFSGGVFGTALGPLLVGFGTDAAASRGGSLANVLSVFSFSVLALATVAFTIARSKALGTVSHLDGRDVDDTSIKPHRVA